MTLSTALNPQQLDSSNLQFIKYQQIAHQITLPQEIWLRVLKYLQPDDLYQTSLVGKQFYALSSDSSLKEARQQNLSILLKNLRFFNPNPVAVARSRDLITLKVISNRGIAFMEDTFSINQHQLTIKVVGQNEYLQFPEMDRLLGYHQNFSFYTEYKCPKQGNHKLMILDHRTLKTTTTIISTTEIPSPSCDLIRCLVLDEETFLIVTKQGILNYWNIKKQHLPDGEVILFPSYKEKIEIRKYTNKKFTFINEVYLLDHRLIIETSDGIGIFDLLEKTWKPIQLSENNSWMVDIFEFNKKTNSNSHSVYHIKKKKLSDESKSLHFLQNIFIDEKGELQGKIVSQLLSSSSKWSICNLNDRWVVCSSVEEEVVELVANQMIKIFDACTGHFVHEQVLVPFHGASLNMKLSGDHFFAWDIEITGQSSQLQVIHIPTKTFFTLDLQQIVPSLEIIQIFDFKLIDTKLVVAVKSTLTSTPISFLEFDLHASTLRKNKNQAL
jgi:hypothetical protein